MRNTAYDGYSVREMRKRWLALKLNMREREKGREVSSRPPQQRRCGVSRRTPPTGLSSQRGASPEPVLLLFGRRIGALGLAKAGTAQQEDLGVLHQPIGDCRGNGRIKEDVAPVGKRRVGSD